ncbi:MAG: hypothetical protein J6T23_02535 [Elusimicrobia bacterium]|nr:hypothetical protein [Elusimicrobiota bacterium]
MLKGIIMWILNKVFKVPTETKQKEVEDNQRYAFEYERIDNINFNAIFSNKLANYVISDSNMNIEGENPRTELLNKTGQSMWKKAKKIVSMGFGYGGLVLIPYVKGNKLFYNLISQSRFTIDSTEGDLITGATVLAEKKEITTDLGKVKTYIRWTNYRLENGRCVIEQKFTDETGSEVPTPSFWQNILLKQTIDGVDRALFGYIKSPINNRKTNDKYGVPITYGCEATINEIKETMKQLLEEFRLKRPFVGVDATLFNGKNGLPTDGLYKSFDFGDQGEKNFEVFDPAFRSYTERLQELYKRLEDEIGTSRGIISDVQTSNATATEIKRAMYDTFNIVDDMRSNVEKGLEDFFYACNVLANAYNLSPMGDYELSFDWSYSLIEDSQESFNQIRMGVQDGVLKKVEERQFLRPDETLEESQKAIDEIEATNPTVDDVLGTRGEE